MGVLNETKKAATDWHRADIIAALKRMAGHYVP